MLYLLRWSTSNIYFARELASRIYENIVELISSQGWSPAATRQFLNQISVEAVGNAVIVKSKNRVFNILELGRRESKPRRLIGKVVPLRLGNGALIFRKVTNKSVLIGKWRVPARPGLRLIERAIKEALGDVLLRSELESPLVISKLRQLVRQRLS